MNRLIGLTILVMGLAAPAHAQTAHAAPMASGSGSPINSTSGGSGAGSGGFGGSSIGSRPLSSPPAHFNATNVSGSRDSYVPSTFVSYDAALAAGKQLIDTPPLTVAEAARRQASAHPEKAKLALVQDDYGRPMIVRR
jgi:hypothetical protein